jgi:hypothetical protein
MRALNLKWEEVLLKNIFIENINKIAYNSIVYYFIVIYLNNSIGLVKYFVVYTMHRKESKKIFILAFLLN